MAYSLFWVCVCVCVWGGGGVDEVLKVHREQQKVQRFIAQLTDCMQSTKLLAIILLNYGHSTLILN